MMSLKEGADHGSLLGHLLSVFLLQVAKMLTKLFQKYFIAGLD